MVSQQPWVSAPTQTDSGSNAGSDDLALGIVRVLLIDRDEVATVRLAGELRPLNHVVSAIRSPQAAVAWLDQRAADIVMLFAESGDRALEGAQFLRSITDLPLIVVGPDASAAHRVGAFDRGAEDYIAPPVYPAELDRRVRALVRRDRLRRRSDELVGPGGIVMYVRSHEVYAGTQRLAVTPKEFAVLRVLLEHRGEVVEPDVMALDVWGHETFGSRNFVEAHISRLRGKLRQAGLAGVIRTVRGVGYVIR